MRKQEIVKKANSLLYRYNGIVKEIIAQRKSYPSEREFWAAWAKFASIVNKLQQTVLIHSINY